jgi:hypothetical protein
MPPKRGTSALLKLVAVSLFVLVLWTQSSLLGGSTRVIPARVHVVRRSSSSSSSSSSSGVGVLEARVLALEKQLRDAGIRVPAAAAATTTKTSSSKCEGRSAAWLAQEKAERAAHAEEGHLHGDARATTYVDVDAHGHKHEHHAAAFPDAAPDGAAVPTQAKPASFGDAGAECKWMQKAYGVEPGKWWGELPSDLQKRWATLACDHKSTVTKAKAVKKEQDPKEPAARPERLAGTEALFVDGNNPLVAIVAPCTTRKMTVRALTDLSLFSTLMPSIVKTVVPGFDYLVVVAFDNGDAYLDSTTVQATITAWFETNVAAKLRARNIDATLLLQAYANPLRKPAPVMNAALRTAYDRNAHFFYRINDDTVLDTPWVNQFVKQLNQWGPPYGAVGPTCPHGNTAILTHDFTTRLHLEIFDSYYPKELTDWYIDDWITRVYGRRRTRRLSPVVVTHRTSAHGTRYTVDKAKAVELPGLVTRGKNRILDWMNANKNTGEYEDVLTDAKVAEFTSDKFRFSVVMDAR